jgi:gluconokinase
MAQRALALDLGSSSVRAIVFETDGKSTVDAVDGALARRPRHLVSDEPGQATFDVDDYFSDLVACIDELHDKGALDGVEVVGTDSQWHSIVPVDGSARPLGPLVSWADTRPPRPAGSPEPGAPTLEQLRQRTGCAFAPMYWTWRAPWLAAQCRAGAGGAGPAHFMGLPEYVGLKLLGDSSMSVSMASGTGLLATAAHTWDDEALGLAGLDGVAAKGLPALAPLDWRGQLSAEWGRRWPALSGVPWHPVVGDGAAANLGVACHVPGRAALTIGTSAAVRAVRPAPDHSYLPAGLWRYCIDGERVVLGAAYSSGGQLYAWALALWEGTAAPSGPSALGATGSPTGAAATPAGLHRELRFDLPMPIGPGSDGVVVLPWHAGTRPPAPGVPAGRGCVLGLGLGHTGAHIVSAAVEAVCFQLASGLADLEPTGGGQLEIVANGGAIDRSPWWRERLAAAVGRPITCPVAGETTARGAAALAFGVELSQEKADAEVVTPDPRAIAALAQARRRWSTWYDELLPLAGAPTNEQRAHE